MSGLARKLGPEAVRFFDTVLRYRANPVSAARRYWKLYRHHRFSPDEIHFQRLLDPTLSELDLERSVSKEELLEVQSRLNPPELHSRTEDKICFHAFCRNLGLPVPDIFALFDVDETPGGGDIPLIRNHEGLERFLCELSARAFILKPVAGVNGEGVMRLDRSGEKWRNTHGKVVSAPDLVLLMSGSPYTRWMFQEVIVGHPDVCALSATTGLQTVRVVTVIDGAGDVSILASRLRLICGNVAHDNFEFGKTGNVIAILDPLDGRIHCAVGGSAKRYEMRSVTSHPVTGRNLIGYQVPRWDAVRSLAIEAARAFWPLRTIGWDVAITSGSPCLIEGNVTWATLSGERRMGEIYRYLKSLADSCTRADTAPA